MKVGFVPSLIHIIIVIHVGFTYTIDILVLANKHNSVLLEQLDISLLFD